MVAVEDNRSPQDKDVDKILYSDELRRLGGVTQVVAIGELPLFHNRLTHSLKVQQLSRRIAINWNAEVSNRGLANDCSVNVAVCEAAGLAHDLGHPPFGHVGEKALDQACLRRGLDGFEGNAQTFRILSKIGRPGRALAKARVQGGDMSPDGLNVTDSTLAAIIKYPNGRDSDSVKKWNYYPTEKSKYEKVVKGGPANPARTVESRIMEWSDDVSNAFHDFEDFWRAGIIPLVTLSKNDSEREEFLNVAEEAILKCEAGSESKEAFCDAKRRWVDDIGKLSEAALSDKSMIVCISEVRKIISDLISDCVLAVRVSDEGAFSVSRKDSYYVQIFSQLIWYYVINSPGLAASQNGQRDMINRVFDCLVEACHNERHHGNEFRIPCRLQALIAISVAEQSNVYPKSDADILARAVADYISSLTELQTLDLYKRFRGTSSASMLDPWMSY